MRRQPAPRTLLCLLLAALLGTACQVRAEVLVDVLDDGSGSVMVAVALDPDAMSRVPGLADELRLDDLAASGWEVSGPAVEDDGHTWIRATKGFATPEGATAVLEEVTGPSGPLRDVVVARERSFARTSFTFAGTVDLSGGIESFADADLVALLDGNPLGEPVADIEARFGVPVDELFSLQVAVALPGGSTSSNAPDTGGATAIWQPRFADAAPVALAADSEVVRTETLALVAIAVLAGIGALVVGVLTPIKRRRRRRDLRPRGRHASFG